MWWGRLVEVLSGQSLDHYLAKHIFGPLEMVDTAFAVAEGNRERLACCYQTDGEGGMVLQDDAADSTYLAGKVKTFSGGGGLLSTAEDYGKFAEMLRCGGNSPGGRLLSPRTLRFMTSNHLGTDLATLGPETWCETSCHGVGFGLGFWVMLDPAKAQLMASAGDYGWGGMASTVFWVDPLEDICVLFLTQLIPSSAYPLRKELRTLVYQALID